MGVNTVSCGFGKKARGQGGIFSFKTKMHKCSLKCFGQLGE